MAIFFLILIIIACVLIGLFILVQNPKGGGLAGNIAGFSTQFMGVKQTTDILEKGTWVLAVIIALLSIASPAFISPGTGTGNEPNLRPTTTQPAPANTAPITPGTDQQPTNPPPANQPSGN
ncbi:MAG: preprotein translocase subunit SecG [Chitinophagaceae bacterium]|nr:preprotein translocase subunit SecG [Chitinophagaceae bacterium]